MTSKIPMVGIKSHVCLGQLDECGRNQSFVTKILVRSCFFRCNLLSIRNLSLLSVWNTETYRELATMLLV